MMQLFEYEGKQLLRKFGVPVPKGHLLTGENAEAPMPYPFLLKAQVMTGGRGKAGGVKVCRNEKGYRENAKSILNMTIKGQPVHGLLAEQMLRVEREFYLSITLQGVERPTLMVSPMGGMDIEQVSRERPEEILKLEIDPFTKLKHYQLERIAKKLDAPDRQGLFDLILKVQDAFFDSGALLLEINPLGLVDGKLAALDAKCVLDDHASAMAPVMRRLESDRSALHAYQSPESEKTTITYVPLSGDVGLISDGAGTGMLTLDLLRDAHVRVASFCELGGMTSEEVMYRAMELTLTGHPEIRAVAVILIGGFNRMDNMARGLTKYLRDHHAAVPVFCRMCGTMQQEGIAIMRENGLRTYDVLSETVEAVAAQAGEGSNRVDSHS